MSESTSGMFGSSALALPNESGWTGFLQRFTYKPGWCFTHESRGDDIIMVEMIVPDTYDPSHKEIRVTSRQKVPPFERVSEAYAKDLIRSLIHELERHEADEWLLFDGVREWDPHAHEFTT